jgi:hypothetical protein
MYKILAVGTSFTHGLALHFYKRKQLGLPLDFNTIRNDELYFNYKHSYSSILGKKLDLPNQIVSSSGSSNFFEGLDIIKKSIEPIYLKGDDKFDHNFFKPKVVILQLTNVTRDFFIYENKVYKLDFETYDGFLKSKKELIDNIDVVDKNDFITKLELELELFTLDEVTWRKNQSAYFISKINILHKILKSKGVILKVISYSDDYKENLDKFDENTFVKIQHNGISYSNIFDFVTINKLRVIDDLGIDDSHPNFEAHEIVADNIYNSILKDPGYYTTFHSII